MEFNKSKVYTAVNADELPVGSKCIFAYTISGLRERVQEDAELYTNELTGILPESTIDRFESDEEPYPIAYLVELPEELEYKPFSSIEKAKTAIDRHGGWVKRIDEDYLLLTTGFANENIILGNGYHCTWEFLFNEFVFIDGTPCGELVEE